MIKVNLSIDIDGFSPEAALQDLQKTLTGISFPTLEITPELEEEIAPIKNAPPPQEDAVQEPEPQKELTLTDLRTVATMLTESNRGDALKAVFKKYGAKKLSEIDIADFNNVYDDLMVIANG